VSNDRDERHTGGTALEDAAAERAIEGTANDSDESVGAEISRAAAELGREIGDEREATVAGERRASRRTRRSQTFMSAAAFVLSLACVVLTAMNVGGFGPFGTPPMVLDEAEAERWIAADVIFAAREIHAAADAAGALPADVSSFDFGQEDGWHYEPGTDGHFTVSLADEGVMATYDSRLGWEAIDVRHLD
jgi:hypothetical protein